MVSMSLPNYSIGANDHVDPREQLLQQHSSAPPPSCHEMNTPQTAGAAPSAAASSPTSPTPQQEFMSATNDASSVPIIPAGSCLLRVRRRRQHATKTVMTAASALRLYNHKNQQPKQQHCSGVNADVSRRNDDDDDKSNNNNTNRNDHDGVTSIKSLLPAPPPRKRNRKDGDGPGEDLDQLTNLLQQMMHPTESITAATTTTAIATATATATQLPEQQEPNTSTVGEPQRKKARRALIWRRVDVKDNRYDTANNYTMATLNNSRSDSASGSSMVQTPVVPSSDENRYRIVDAILEEYDWDGNVDGTNDSDNVQEDTPHGRVTKRPRRCKLTLLGDSNASHVRESENKQSQQQQLPNKVVGALAKTNKSGSNRKKVSIPVLHPLERLVDDALLCVHTGEVSPMQHVAFLTNDVRLDEYRRWMTWSNADAGNLLHAIALWNQVDFLRDFVTSTSTSPPLPRMLGSMAASSSLFVPNHNQHEGVIKSQQLVPTTKQQQQQNSRILEIWIQACNGDGMTPYQVAQMAGHDQICALLEVAGVQPKQDKFRGKNSSSSNKEDDFVTDLYYLDLQDILDDDDDDDDDANRSGRMAGSVTTKDSSKASEWNSDCYNKNNQHHHDVTMMPPLDCELEGGVGYWNEQGELVLQVSSSLRGQYSEYHLNKDGVDQEDGDDDDDQDSNHEAWAGNDYPDDEDDDDHERHDYYDYNDELDANEMMMTTNDDDISFDANDDASSDDDPDGMLRDNTFRNVPVQVSSSYLSTTGQHAIPQQPNRNSWNGQVVDTTYGSFLSPLSSSTARLHHSMQPSNGDHQEDDADEGYYDPAYGIMHQESEYDSEC